MADKKISQLPAATTPLVGTEVLPIVQSGVTDQVSVANLTAGRAVSMASGTVTGNLTVDTTTLKVDATNHRVGIGLASPAFQLDVLSSLSGTTAGSNAILNVSSNASGRDSHIRLNDTVNASGRIGYLSGDMYLWTGGASRLSIAQAGDVTVNTGNLVVGTSGKGIDLSAVTNPAGTTNKILTAYAEGTWTPTVTASSGTFTTVSATGKFTRIGNAVNFSASITITDKGTAASACIFTLPYTAAATTCVAMGREINSTGYSLQATIAASGSTANIQKYDNTAMIQNGYILVITGTYFI